MSGDDKYWSNPWRTQEALKHYPSLWLGINNSLTLTQLIKYLYEYNFVTISQWYCLVPELGAWPPNHPRRPKSHSIYIILPGNFINDASYGICGWRWIKLEIKTAVLHNLSVKLIAGPSPQSVVVPGLALPIMRTSTTLFHGLLNTLGDIGFASDCLHDPSKRQCRGSQR